MDFFSLLQRGFSLKNLSNISSGIPKLLFVTMGLQDDPTSKSEVGWYNNYSYRVYQSNNLNIKKSKKEARKDLEKEIADFSDKPSYTLIFFRKKLLSTWLEPSYQSIWSGVIESGGLNHSKLINNIYNGGKVYKIIENLMRVIMFFIYLFSSYYCFKSLFKVQKIDFFPLLPIIYFIGGTFFHLIWETKSQYVYPYVLLLIIPACYGLMDILKKLNKKKPLA